MKARAKFRPASGPRRRAESEHLELYYWAGPPQNCQVVVSGAEARHIAKVMRHKVGDRIRVTDGAGNEHEVELREVGSGRVRGEVLSTSQGRREPKHRVAVAQAVLKGDHLVRVCAQTTELGVSRMIPVWTARTLGRLGEAKYRRLRAAALAALKSSTRTVLPVIEQAVGFDRLLELARGYDQVLVAYEEETRCGLSDVLRRDAESVLLVVGPEGGLEPAEIAALKAKGAAAFSLGPRRLRAETAAIAAAAMTFGLLGDLGSR